MAQRPANAIQESLIVHRFAKKPCRSAFEGPRPVFARIERREEYDGYADIFLFQQLLEHQSVNSRHLEIGNQTRVVFMKIRR